MSKALMKVAQSVATPQLAELTSMSGFRKIALLNNLAGNRANGGWDAVDAQLKLIKSEFKELCDAIEARDVENLRGEIADMLVVVLGMAHRLGVDADDDLQEVVLSNLTKFDPSDDPAAVQATVAKHLANGIETVQIEVDDPLRAPGSDRKLYVTRSAYDQNGKDGKFYPKGKWLKSAAFVEPEMPALPLMAAAALGQIKLHRDLGDYGFGVYVQAVPEENSYIVRSIDTFTIGDVTVHMGDFILIKDVDTVKDIAVPFTPTVVEDPNDDGRSFDEVVAENLSKVGTPIAAGETIKLD